MEIESIEEMRVVVNDILAMLSRLEPDARRRVLATVVTFLKYDDIRIDNQQYIPQIVEQRKSQTQLHDEGEFSTDRTISAKQFVFDKNPLSDVDRIACLAYYLTHYQNMLEFQTRDVSLLNTEAAQRKFSNPSFSMRNAARSGYIIQGSKNYWRLSAIGEVYVRALPDRNAARDALAEAKPPRKTKRASAKRASAKRTK